MTKILALDTATDACSVALLTDDALIDRWVLAPQQHSKIIFPMIQEILIEAQIDLAQLDALAFTCGPGSFTGVRLGTTIVQGLAFAQNLPVIRVSTLRTLAQQSWQEYGTERVIAALDARMHELYLGQYRLDANKIMQAVAPDCLVKPDYRLNLAEQWSGVGNGWEIYSDFLADRCNITQNYALCYPQAKAVATIAVDDWRKGLGVTAEAALPTYLRDEVAWV